MWSHWKNLWSRGGAPGKKIIGPKLSPMVKRIIWRKCFNSSNIVLWKNFKITVDSTKSLLVQLDDFYSLLFNIFLFSQYVHLRCGFKNTDSRAKPAKISSEIWAEEISLYENFVHFIRKKTLGVGGEAPGKEDSQIFVFWTMKILLFKKRFLHWNVFSNPLG